MSLEGKKILVLCADNFQDMELMYPYYRLIEEGADVFIVGVKDGEYKGKYGYPVDTHGSITDYNPKDCDAVIVPGGWAPDKLRRSKEILNFVRAMDEEGKIIAAICHGPWVLVSAGILNGRRVTCFDAIKDDVVNAGAEYHDEAVIIDENIVTSRTPDDLPEFCRAVIGLLEMKKVEAE